MVVFGFADIDGDGHAGVRDGEGLEHGFADEGAEAGGFEAGELDPGEGEVGAPLGAPVFDEEGELGAVEGGFFEGGAVVLALIPDGAAKGVGEEGGDHAVVEVGGTVLVGVGVGFVAGGARGFGASGFGFGGGVFPGGEAFGVGGFGGGFVEGGGFLVPGVDVGFEGGDLELGGFAGPGGDVGAAPGGVDHADGGFEFLMEVLAEEPGDGGEVLDGVRGGDDPFALAVGLGDAGGFLVDAEHADGGEVGGGGFGGRVEAAFELEGHVGLAGGEPDFADEDVVDGEGGAAFDGELLGLVAGCEFAEADAPSAIGDGSGGGGLIGDGDGDGVAGFGPAPDVEGLVGLDDHVVGDEGGEFEIDFPIVGAEGGGGEAGAVFEGPGGVVGPGVADGDGVFHLGGSDDDAAVDEAGVGGDEVFVGAGDGKAG